jgi:hypothetical protein
MAQRLDRDGKLLSAPFYISQGAGHARQYPDVAYNSQANEYLVVWGDLDHSTNWLTIQSRRVSASGAVLDPVDILISNYGANYQAAQPAVAYSSAADRYMVVWSERMFSPLNSGIYARKITPEGYYEGSIFPVSQPAYQLNNPDIAYNSSTDRYLVVWQEVANVTSKSDIRGCQVNGSGGVYSTVFDIESFTNNATHPAVAAIGSSSVDAKFLVIYDYEFLLTDHEIYGSLIENNGAIASVIFPATSYNSERNPAVAGSEGTGEYLLVWREEIGSGDNHIKACPYDSAGNWLGDTYEFSGVSAGMPSAASGPLGDFLIAWIDHPVSRPNRDVFGALFGNRNYVPLIGK